MPEIDDELVARALRWCAEAGRHASPEAVRAALAPLGWDELIAARALLADPPPARPLGPQALADLARGALPDVAAEREREGRYRSAAEPAPPPGSAPPAPTPPAGRRGQGRVPRAAGPVIRRARDRVAPAPPAVRGLPLVDELFASEGRAVLERLVRRHGARRAAVVAALGLGWRHADGAPPREDDLGRLLDAHGLVRWFERRERDALLHALRAAGGVRAAAARQLALASPELELALDRLGARQEAEAIRRAHREEVRRRATLSERVRLLLAEEERLTDLGLLEEVEADLRRRLPEHVRALRASAEAPLRAALSQSLAIPPREVATLAARLRVELEPTRDAVPARTPAPPRTSAPRTTAPRTSAPRTAPRTAPPRTSARPTSAASRRGGAPRSGAAADPRQAARGAGRAPRGASTGARARGSRPRGGPSSARKPRPPRRTPPR